MIKYREHVTCERDFTLSAQIELCVLTAGESSQLFNHLSKS